MNIHSHSGDDLKPIDGRIPVLVTDYDKAAYIHFLALAPVGMSLPDAKKKITEAYTEALGSGDANNEWNYEDVEKILVEWGFTCHDVAVWEETSEVS